MKILKYKKLKTGKYELTMENDKKISLYEDTILKYNLLITKDFDLSDEEIINFDKKCDTYYIGLKYLSNRARSKKEVYDKLKSLKYPTELIELSLEKLEKQGYINDLFYAKSFLNNKLITTCNGPYKIKKDMINKGISDDICDEVLLDYTEDIQLEKIRKIIKKDIKSNRNKGNSLLRKKILNDLSVQGFDKKLIVMEIDNTEFQDDSELLKKEYDKLYKKLSSKYSGSELDLKIRQKLYQKGFKYP